MCIRDRSRPSAQRPAGNLGRWAVEETKIMRQSDRATWRQRDRERQRERDSDLGRQDIEGTWGGKTWRRRAPRGWASQARGGGCGGRRAACRAPAQGSSPSPAARSATTAACSPPPPSSAAHFPPPQTCSAPQTSPPGTAPPGRSPATREPSVSPRVQARRAASEPKSEPGCAPWNSRIAGCRLPSPSPTCPADTLPLSPHLAAPTQRTASRHTQHTEHGETDSWDSTQGGAGI
eukprot:3703081-Rhodomonas_salina.3